jgi:hypothetical protein
MTITKRLDAPCRFRGVLISKPESECLAIKTKLLHPALDELSYDRGGRRHIS